MKKKVVLIVLYDHERRFLLQHRSKDARLCPGYWAFFGGSVEERETPLEAIHRETLEEINLKLKTPQLIIELDFKEGNVSCFIYVYMEAFNSDKSVLRLQEGQGFGWFKESEMANLKMLERDRQIIRTVLSRLEKVTV